jgi:alpha-tubulin suppressor-like RCC1 family protein
MSSNQRQVVNFINSDGVDIAQEWITKDYLMSVYPEIADKIGIPPELWTWGSQSDGKLGNTIITGNVSTPVTTFSGGTDWKQISAGTDHTVAIKTDGTLWAWGNGGSGRLGDNSTVSRSTPVTTFAGGNNWKQVAAGGSHTAAIKTDGTLWIWGNGDSGILGNNPPLFFEEMPIPVTTFAGGNNWADTATGEPDELYTLSAGGSHTAAVKTDGTLWTWGNGIGARLGNNDITNRSTPVTTFSGGTNWKQVSSGGSHTAAVKTDGTLWAWGNVLASGRLANTTIIGSISTPVTTFAGGNNWADTATTPFEPDELYTLSAGTTHTAAIKTDGTLWVWGNGNVGRLGDATITNVSTPVTTFAGGNNWKQVSTGDSHTAAVKTDGTLWTWGNGGSGRLGNSIIATSNISTPVTTFAGGTDWKQVAAGTLHTAAIKTDGTLWTWGNGGSGSLGNSIITGNISTPVTTFAGGTDWKQVAAGTTHTAAIKTDGTLWIWGNGGSGRLGNSIITGNRSTPVTTFAGGTNWKQVSAGTTHTAAVKTDGTLWTWGLGSYGRLGDSLLVNRSTPVTTFAGGTNWKQVSAGDRHTAAVKTDGTLWTWGNGANGRLGTNDATNRSTPVTTFAGGTDWKQVAAGGSHTIALRDDGVNKELFAFGNNFVGQLGENLNSNGFAPSQTFAGGSNWKQVAAGDIHTSAVKTDGTLWTWGLGTNGQLGDNSTTSSFTPVTTFSGGTNWKQVSSGYRSTSAVKTDGTLWTWGFNGNGQIGDNSTTTRSTPVTTFTGGNNWKQVSSGNRHTAAIKTDGTLWTWGNGTIGQLGRQYSTAIEVPIRLDPTNRIWADTATGEADELYTLSAGDAHTAAIKTDGTLWTWGAGSYGRLGNATIISVTTPVTTFAGGTNWKQVSAGDRHTAAVKTDGTLWTWGLGNYGRLGNAATAGNVSTPVTTSAGGNNWKQVAAGTQYTAAVKTDGTLWTWGRGLNGRLGRQYSTTVQVPVRLDLTNRIWADTATTPFEPDELYTLSAGTTHTAAIKTDGTLWTWGNGGSGRLGTNDTTTRSTPVTTFAGGTDWKQVSTGDAHTAAIKTDGTLWTWGLGTSGRLGDATLTTKSIPVTTFAGGIDWKQVATGDAHTAAIKTDGTLWTWGLGTSGRLGDATTTTSSTPVTTFAGGTNWKQVSAGFLHTTAIKTDGTLWTWGNGDSGRLGRQYSTTVQVPVRLDPTNRIWADTATTPFEPDELYTLSAGNLHTAAIKTDGTLWNWGRGVNGQLGTNDTSARTTPTTTFAGGTNWKQVSCGGYYTAAIKTDGTLWTWGLGNNGRLGNAALTTNVVTPVTTFAGGTDWKQVAAGTTHTAAIKTDGTLWTWGNGGSGSLGNIIITGTRSTPVTTFAGGTNWKQVSAGDEHTAAVKTDGTLWIWGNGGSGRLGTNDTTTRSTPVTTFSGGTDWKQVSAGGIHTAAVKTDGTLWTWGFGGSARLGDATLTTRSTPVTTFAGGNNWKQVAAGSAYTAAVKTDGTLWTWGAGFDGRLGTNDTTNRSTPVTTFAGGTNWKQVAAAAAPAGGGNHTVALRDDGVNKDLFAFGNNGNGQLGIILSDIVPGSVFSYEDTWKQVAAGTLHTAAVKTDGTLWTWGGGTYGRLGDNTLTSTSTPVTTFAGGTNWKQVATGDAHTAAVKTDGTLWTWGQGNSGRLGTNDATNRSTPVTTFAGGTDWKQVVAGGSHTVALRDDGVNKDLFAFGSNGVNQLGIQVLETVPGPVFSYEDTWKQVSAGESHTAAIKTDGTLWTWGLGTNGQLGDSTITTSSTPVTTFSGGTDWKQVAAGTTHTAAIKTDGTLWTWGLGSSGQLGNANLTNRSTPVTTFAGGTNWKQVSAGIEHTSAVKTDGTLWTWGLGSSGQLGTNDTTTRSTPVTTFAGGTDWKQVATGGSHTVALRDDGVNKDLFAFGNNGNAQLGIILSNTIPGPVFSYEDTWKQVSAGYQHTSAVKTDGTLWTWGNGGSGRLGTNDNTPSRSTPVTTFAGGTNWKQVAAGDSHTVALRDDGVNKELFTFGATSDGKLGIGPLPSVPVAISTPVTTFSGGNNWKQVATGGSHTAAVKTDGTLWTWGNGTDGILGNNDTSIRSTPVTTFAGGNNWKQVAAGTLHTAAIKTDGTLWTWGLGISGQLGDSTITSTSTPVTTFAGGSSWKQVTIGGSHTAAVKTDGTLWTWGSGLFGQLGDNNITINSTPVTTFAGGTNWKQVNAGTDHTIATKTDGTLWTWGNGANGRLGNSLLTDSSTPVTTFAGGTNWKQVAAGGSHTIAIRSIDFIGF